MSTGHPAESRHSSASIDADALSRFTHDSGLPTIVRVTPNLYFAHFRLVKLLPARAIIEEAQVSGKLRPGDVVVETSSGSFALALAVVCRNLPYRLHIIGDRAIDSFVRRHILSLGAQLTIVDGTRAALGSQRARLELLHRVRRNYARSFWPRQYDNPTNPLAFRALAEYLRRKIATIDCLVGAVGSGGTMCGTVRALRRTGNPLRAVAVDTHGSVLFGQQDKPPRILRGAGSSVMFGNVDHRTFDQVHWVTAAEAFASAHELRMQQGVFTGATGGAAAMVARWYAQQNPKQSVIAILPDEGHRYLHTFYDPDWLRAHEVELLPPPDKPELVARPDLAAKKWSMYRWNRRSYRAAVGNDPPAGVPAWNEQGIA
ncbi:MAG: pyridoxal-phosphate dependent enzyme [Planctomycetota bacterium]